MKSSSYAYYEDIISMKIIKIEKIQELGDTQILIKSEKDIYAVVDIKNLISVERYHYIKKEKRIKDTECLSIFLERNNINLDDAMKIVEELKMGSI